MSKNPQTSGIDRPPILPFTTTKKIWRDFGLGLVGCLVGNAVLVIAAYLLSMGLPALKLSLSHWLGAPLTDTLMDIVGVLIWGLPWVLNTAVIILALVKRHPGIVLGMLTGFALAFVLVLVAGIIFMATCFLTLNSI